MNESSAEIDHVAVAWTVGELRQALAEIPDDMPLVAWVSDVPGHNRFVSEQVVVGAGFAQVDEGNGYREDRSEFGIELDWPTGRYPHPAT